MKQEDEELLLRDLCSRLPYGVKVLGKNMYISSIDAIHKLDLCTLVHLTEVDKTLWIEDVKPYLRPMSSMTEEEKKELKANTCPEGTGYFDEKYLICPMSHYGEQISYDFMSVILEWLNSHHLDYRGLIPKGLALPAPPDMYRIN